MLTVYALFMAAFVPKWQNSLVTTETKYGLQRLKYLLSGLIQKIFASVWYRLNTHTNMLYRLD